LVFFYAVVILRISYFSNLDDIAKNIDLNNYVNLKSHYKIFENINYLNCANIIIFFYVFVQNIKVFSKEFMIIQRVLSKVNNIIIFNNIN